MTFFIIILPPYYWDGVVHVDQWERVLFRKWIFKGIFVLCVCSCAHMWTTAFRRSSHFPLVWNRASSICILKTGESSVPTSCFPLGEYWALKGDFYVGSGDSNSCYQACMANAFTHWAISPATREWIFYIFVYLFCFLKIGSYCVALGTWNSWRSVCLLTKGMCQHGLRVNFRGFDLTRSGGVDL